VQVGRWSTRSLVIDGSNTYSAGSRRLNYWGSSSKGGYLLQSISQLCYLFAIYWTTWRDNLTWRTRNRADSYTRLPVLPSSTPSPWHAFISVNRIGWLQSFIFFICEAVSNEDPSCGWNVFLVTLLSVNGCRKIFKVDPIFNSAFQFRHWFPFHTVGWFSCSLWRNTPWSPRTRRALQRGKCWWLCDTNFSIRDGGQRCKCHSNCHYRDDKNGGIGGRSSHGDSVASMYPCLGRVGKCKTYVSDRREEKWIGQKKIQNRPFAFSRQVDERFFDWQVSISRTLQPTNREQTWKLNYVRLHWCLAQVAWVYAYVHVSFLVCMYIMSVHIDMYIHISSSHMCIHICTVCTYVYICHMIWYVCIYNMTKIHVGYFYRAPISFYT